MATLWTGSHSDMVGSPYILLDDQLSGQCRHYVDPVEIITASSAKELMTAFHKIDGYLQRGLYVAGYISYEAGFILEPKLSPLLQASYETPLLQMGVFKSWSDKYPKAPCEAAPQLSLTPNWNEAEYIERFNKVLDYITAGDVYQINLTFPLISEYSGSAFCLYDTLRARQPVHYGGVIALGGAEIVSFSPELFFDKKGETITMRPMKGTVKRLPDRAADLALRDAMKVDTKSQAENLMIVDLLRNDLSRIAQKASVKVPHLFSLETYPTLHQMTSTVTAKVDKTLPVKTLFENLFPCGSVTGAPKIRAMEIIHELETVPRGPYCGAIGYLDPDGDACFNVAIRTAIIQNGQLRYHVGSGVVLDSDGQAEYDECLLKAKMLSSNPDLIETFRWSAAGDILRKNRHMTRLKQSAKALGYPLDEAGLESELANLTGNHDLRVRLTLSSTGNINLTPAPFTALPSPLKLSISRQALTQGVQDTRHKTTARDFYDGERNRLKSMTGCNEVIFFNERGELCEGSFTNIFIEIEGQLYTPPLSSGLLAGILRSELLENQKAIERVLFITDVTKADAIFVGNSLRGLLKAELISPSPL